MTGLLADPFCRNHDTGPGHPERPQRFAAAMDGLKQSGLEEKLTRLEPREVTPEELLLGHSAEYLTIAEREITGGEDQLSTGDTNVCPESWNVARRAVGGALAAVNAVVEGKVRNAFCAMRPPGHHATPNRGMGFCVFNNVAIAARYAQRRHGIGRVLILDWDVHHGNGTQDIYYSDGSVSYMSTHQSPFYPRTGAIEETGSGAGAGLILNRPVPESAGDAEVVGAYRNDFLPAGRRFAPDLVLVSAGFDSRVDDRLGRLRVTDEGYRELTRVVLEIADVAGGGRLVSVLEG